MRRMPASQFYPSTRHRSTSGPLWREPGSAATTRPSSSRPSVGSARTPKSRSTCTTAGSSRPGAAGPRGRTRSSSRSGIRWSTRSRSGKAETAGAGCGPSGSHPALRPERALLPIARPPVARVPGVHAGPLHRPAHLSHRLQQVGAGAGRGQPGSPRLYPHLTHLFEVGRLESEELVRKAQKLEELLEAHTGKTRRLPYEGKQGGPLDGGHAEKWLDVPAIASHRRFPERPVGRALPRNRPGVSSARRDWRVSRQLSQSGGHQAVRRLRVRRSLLSRRLGLTN